MVKKPSKSILVLKCFKKFMLITGVCSLLLAGGTFRALASSGLNAYSSGDLQQRSVTGKVVDATNNPMAGVNVLEKGTANGVLTGVDGKFSISVSSPNAILSFSFIGYEAVDVAVGTQAVINVTLTESLKGLEEVVVVGYGTVKKRDLTGSVSSVKSQDIVANAPTTVQQALQGKAAGMVITSGNSVNSLPTLRIRGNRSVTATNDPLFVIDGVPTTGGMETINPNDVESMEVLKDASATAIYGSRGANGVIMVTTKKGQAGKVTVEYDAYASIGYLNRLRTVFNASQFTDYVRDAARQYTYDGNGGYAINTGAGYGYEQPNYNADMGCTYLSAGWDPYINESLKEGWVSGVWTPANLRSFNWQMAGYRDNTTSQNHSISIRGGSENTKVFVSGSYMNLADITLQSNRKRYTLRLNLDQNLGKRITMGGDINFSFLSWINGRTIGTSWSPLGTPYYSPGGDVTKTGDPALGLIPRPAGEPLNYNPFYDITGVVTQNKNNRLFTNLYMTVNLLKGLSYRANFGSNLNITQNQEFDSHFSTVTNLGNPKAYQNLTFDRGWTFENILSYNTTIKDHSIGATFVQANEKSVSEPVTATGNALPMETQLWYSLGSASSQSCTSGFTQWTMMSWLGRVTYSYKSKYLLTASLRYDGSSRLATGHKWVSFPSVALAWRISDEEFMKGISVIDNLKLRVGYGVTGNSAVSPYSTVGQITSSRYNWDKTTGAMGYAPLSLSNSDLSWEKTAQYNVGLDFGILKDRISGAVELYLQNTSDLLMTRSIPTITGFSNIVQNIGETRNKGLEISLNTVNISTGKISWTTSLTFATNKEEITKLATGLPQDLNNQWFVGYPVDTYYNYVAAPKVWGYSAEDEAEMAKFNANGANFKPGDLRLVDFNGDYKITDADRQIRGSKMPKWTPSMANTFKYGPFDLYVFMYGAFGQTIYWDPGVQIGGRYNSYVNDYWTPTHTDTKWLAPHTDIQMPSNISAMYYWKGDFLKISDLTLGYTLPEQLTGKAKIQSIRFYAKVQNPFMFTNFEGVDPEGSISQQRVNGALVTYGDQSFTMRTYMLGVNVTF
ncbi:MAG: TonB-dependent receptor [Bacteroidales bacterium]